MSENELNKKVGELQDRAWSIWTEAHSLMSQFELDDRLFFSYPIKAPTMEIIDHLNAIRLKLLDKIKA